MTKVSTLHRDAVGSVRAVTTAAGARAEKALYRPYGEEVAQSFDLVTAPETKGFIGERFDADRDVQAVSEDVVPPVDDIAGVQSDAKLDAVIDRKSVV